MSIHFVSTSILESEDGVDFGKETASKAIAQDNRELKRKGTGGSSLYDQLTAQRDAKQEDFEKNGARMRAPTSGLDQDDIDYFHDREMKDRDAHRIRVKEDDEEIASFMKKRRDTELGHHEATKSVLRKRKSTINGSPQDRSSFDDKLIKSAMPIRKVQRVQTKESGTSVTPEKPTSNTLTVLLSGYDSDDD